MSEHIAVGLKKLGPIMTVNNAFIQNKFAIHILFVNHMAVSVKLIGMPFCPKSDKCRKCSKVVDMVIYGSDPKRTEIGYDHGTMERADVQE